MILPLPHKLLILDLDETLIYSTTNELERPCDFKVFDYFVYKRPGVEDFISDCANWFQLAVWTSSGCDYAREIIQHIFPESVQLQFVFTSERCTARFDGESGKYFYSKPLKKIKRKGYSLNQVLIVDDTPETFLQNYGNAILVQKYEGFEEDRELFVLLKYLDIIRFEDDLRSTDKRGWRRKVANID
jgi:RNA polymerase II subunit A small phosphatase-like protein